MRAHPDNSKMKVKKSFPCFAWNDHCYTPLCCSASPYYNRTTSDLMAMALTYCYLLVILAKEARIFLMAVAEKAVITNSYGTHCWNFVHVCI